MTYGRLWAALLLLSVNSPSYAEEVLFPRCSHSLRYNCVVDGDTFWLSNTKIRIADIDAPETEHFKCEQEKILGDLATLRLSELLNDGNFQLVKPGGRSRDFYGRELRIVVRSGKSVGAELVDEGLARRWDGSRHPWC